MEPAAERASDALEMAPLIETVRRGLSEAVKIEIGGAEPEELELTWGVTRRDQGKAEVLIGAQVAVELGHPETASRATVLTTYRADLIRHGRISRLGPDLPELPLRSRAPIGQIVMLGLEADARPDPFALEATQYLFNRIPGYMIRAVPGRLWVRVSRDGRRRGLDLSVVGRALMSAYLGEFADVRAVEVAFVTSGDEAVEALAPVVLESEARSGRHKRLILTPEGELGCRELSCETCSERAVCDAVRDIISRRRERR